MKPLRSPVGGRTMDRLTLGLLMLFGIGLAMIVWRFIAGIGPVSGLSPPSPNRKTVERSASETGILTSVSACARRESTASEATMQQMGSVRPPCGGIKLDMWMSLFGGLGL